MSRRKILPAVEPPAQVDIFAAPSDAFPTEERLAVVIAVASPFMVAESQRLAGNLAQAAPAPEGIIEAVADEAGPLSSAEITDGCRVLLLRYLTDTAGFAAAEADAATERAIRALAPPPPAARDDTKLARLIALLRRRQGATLAEMVEATGWKTNSVRGALSGTLKKKLGLAVVTEKAEGARVYRLPGEG